MCPNVKCHVVRVFLVLLPSCAESHLHRADLSERARSRVRAGLLLVGQWAKFQGFSVWWPVGTLSRVRGPIVFGWSLLLQRTDNFHIHKKNYNNIYQTLQQNFQKKLLHSERKTLWERIGLWLFVFAWLFICLAVLNICKKIFFWKIHPLNKNFHRFSRKKTP